MMLNITTGFSIFPVIPVSVNAFSAEIGQSRVYTTPAPYYNVHIFSFIRSGSSNHLTSTMQIVSTQTKCLTNGDTASLHTACYALSCPIIIRLINGSLSTFLKDVLAMKLFEAQGLHINV